MDASSHLSSHRQCAACSCPLPRCSFSNNQWAKGTRHGSRCRVCVDIGLSAGSGSPGTGLASPAVLQASYFLRACAQQALGSTTLTLDDDTMPPVPASAMAAALAQHLPDPCSLPSLLAAGVALHNLLQQLPQPPTPSPAAIFLAPYSPALAALAPAAHIALLLTCDLACLPAPITTLVTASLAQRYASLPRAAFEAECAAPSPRCAALVLRWWAEQLQGAASAPGSSCQLRQAALGSRTSCRAWATSCMPFAPAAAASLPPVAFGLDASSPPEEHWARGLDHVGGAPPPSHAALLALAFGRAEWVQRSQHASLAGHSAWALVRGGSAPACCAALAEQAGDAAAALLLCGALWHQLQSTPWAAWKLQRQQQQQQQVKVLAVVAQAMRAHRGEPGVAWAGFGALCCAGHVQPAAPVQALSAGSGGAAAIAGQCWALQQVASQPGRRGACLALGALPLVVRVLGQCQGDAAVALHACGALLELARAAPCAAAAAPAVAAALLAHAGCAGVAEVASAALLCMAVWEGEACAAAGAGQALELALALAPAGSCHASVAAAALHCLQRGVAEWGGLVVSGSEDLTVRVWHAATGVCVRVLEMEACALELEAVGEGRISAVTKGLVGEVWDVARGVRCSQAPCSTFRGKLYAAYTERYWFHGYDCSLQDGRMAMGGDLFSVLVRHPIIDEPPRQMLLGHTDCVMCACQMADGWLVSGAEDCTLRVWELATEVCVQVLAGHTGSVECVCTLLPEASGPDPHAKH